MFEMWPFTNFHDLNLDWIIGKIKNIEDSEAAAKASEDAASGYAADAKSSKTQAAIFATQAGQKADNAADSAESIANVVTTVNDDHARLDALIGAGTTTVDNSELIDIRAGAVASFNLAGNETRYTGLMTESIPENYDKSRPTPAQIHPYSVLNPNGTIAALAQTTANEKYRVLEYSVNAGEVYDAWTYSQYNNALGAFLDSNDDVIGHLNGRSGADSYAHVKRFVIPAGCVKFLLADYHLTGSTPSMRCFLAKHVTADDCTVPEGIINTLSPASENTVTLDFTGGQNYAFNYSGGWEQSLSGYQWAIQPVLANAQYRITGWTYYDYKLYGFMKADGTMVWATEYTSAKLDKYIYIPADCVALVIQGKISDPSTLALVTSWTYTGSGYWQGKKWTAFGDSLTENNATANNKYHSIISALTGITVNNMGLSGSAYGRPAGSTFYERASSIPSDSDIVTIFGSFNDSASGLPIGTPTDTGTSTLCGCMNKTLENVFSVKTDMVVGLITPTPWVQFNPFDGQSQWAQDYVEAIVKVAERWSVPVLDLYHESGLRPWNTAANNAEFYNADGNHPNNRGHEIIAPKILEFMKTLLHD